MVQKYQEWKKKYCTTSDYNKFTSNTLDAKTTQNKLVNECDFSKKTKTLATKREIKKNKGRIESRAR